MLAKGILEHSFKPGGGLPFGRGKILAARAACGNFAGPLFDFAKK
jgi:hypothetical protein